MQALSVLWNEGPSTVGTVLKNLPDRRERAYTTVLSVLQGMEKKGLVKRKKAGKAHVYSAAKSQTSILGATVKNFVRDHFQDSIGAALSALLKAGKLTEDEKKEATSELKASKTIKARKKAKLAEVKAKPAKKKSAKKLTKKAAKKAVKKSAKKAAKKSTNKVTKKTAKKVTKKAPRKKG